MEKAGSGLSDVYRFVNENGGEVSFGPVDDNNAFEVTIYCRKEVVDDVTKTASPLNVISTRYASNLLEVVKLPEVVWHAGTKARKAEDVWDSTEAEWLPPFVPYARRLFSFHNLKNPANPLHSQIDINDIETVSTEEFAANQDGERRFVWLLNECLYRHLEAQGLCIDKKRMRAYFPRTEEGPREITYQARVRQATRTIVKQKPRYWEHQSFWFRFERFDDTWALLILPGYVFTINGWRNLLDGDRVNVLSTKRASRDYNNVVHNNLVFWTWILSGGEQGIFSLKMGPNFKSDSSPNIQEYPTPSSDINIDHTPQILLKATLPTTVAHDVEIDETLRQGLSDEQDSAELAELEKEISRLAISQSEEE
jgi:hypothetical protein